MRSDTPISRTLSPARAMVYGTAVVGVLDIADALVFFGLRGAQPTRVLQAIAAGVLGRDAFAGGAGTALLGLALHFLIAFAVVAVYHAAGTRLPALTRHPYALGAAYGVAVYGVMNYVVIPLSAFDQAPPTPPVLVNGLLIHVLGVGIPSALFARAARPRAADSAPPAGTALAGA